MANVLKNTISFIAVAAGATATLPHGLNLNDTPQIPSELSSNNAAFSVVSATTTTVTVTNNGTVAGDCAILAEYWHSFERVLPNGAPVLPVTPFVNRGAGGAAATSTSWIGTRYFAVDYDGGSDSNLGYSDVSMAAAGLVAVKTLEYLRLAVFPKDGNGQTAIVAIKARAGGATYRNIANTADDSMTLAGISGYQNVTVRGTGDVPTANAVAFANDPADRVACGAQIVAGTSATGYNPIAPITTLSFDVQINGGGAPGLAAEPGIIGKRIRFDANTATAALRNQARMVYANDANTITISDVTSVVPTPADIFYIEEPGVAVSTVHFAATNNGSTASTLATGGNWLVGMRTVGVGGTKIVISCPTNLVGVSFCETPLNSLVATVIVTNAMQGFNVSDTYRDADSLNAITGVGCRSDGIAVMSAGVVQISSAAGVMGRFLLDNVAQFNVGAGCYVRRGLQILRSGHSPAPASLLSTTFAGMVGNFGSASVQPMRIEGQTIGAVGGNAGCIIDSSNLMMYGCNISNVGTNPTIRVNGIGLSLSFQAVGGTVGNTGDGITVQAASACNIAFGDLAPNIYQITNVDRRGIFAGGAHSGLSLNRSDFRDANGNHFWGTADRLVGSVFLATNNGSVDLFGSQIVRATADPYLVTTAQADTFANASGIAGIGQTTALAVGNEPYVVADTGVLTMNHDALVPVGAVAYLSEITAGNCTPTPPPAAGTNQKLRLGVCLRNIGSLSFIQWRPEILPVLSDGLP